MRDLMRNLWHNFWVRVALTLAGVAAFLIGGLFSFGMLVASPEIPSGSGTPGAMTDCRFTALEWAVPGLESTRMQAFLDTPGADSENEAPCRSHARVQVGLGAGLALLVPGGFVLARRASRGIATLLRDQPLLTREAPRVTE